MVSQINVLVVYVNFRASKDVVRSISSLKTHIPRSLEIVVVDNSPEDDGAEIRDCFSDVRVVRAPENLGFAGGCNLGVASAKTAWKYLLLLNPDTYCQADFLSPLLSLAEAESDWGILSPKINNSPNDEAAWYAGSKLNWWRGGPKQLNEGQLSETKGIVGVPFASGCCSLIRHSAWQQAGPIDSAFFLYFEDADLSERVKQQGSKIGYVPGVAIIHEESKTTGYQSPLYLYYFSRNRLLFLRRWAPTPAKLFYFWFHFLVKIPGAWVVFGLLRKDLRRSLAFTQGAIDGLLGRSGPNWKWHG